MGRGIGSVDWLADQSVHYLEPPLERHRIEYLERTIDARWKPAEIAFAGKMLGMTYGQAATLAGLGEPEEEGAA